LKLLGDEGLLDFLDRRFSREECFVPPVVVFRSRGEYVLCGGKNNGRDGRSEFEDLGRACGGIAILEFYGICSPAVYDDLGEGSEADLVWDEAGRRFELKGVDEAGIERVSDVFRRMFGTKKAFDLFLAGILVRNPCGRRSKDDAESYRRFDDDWFRY